MVKHKILVKKLDDRAIIPSRQSLLASGYDLHALGNYLVYPGQFKSIRTGIAVEIPEHCELQIRPRSGLSKQFPCYIANSPGTIDADYRGEIFVLVYNHAIGRIWNIRSKDRIAQMVLVPLERANLQVIKELSLTERGSGGMGSTGLK